MSDEHRSRARSSRARAGERTRAVRRRPAQGRARAPGAAAAGRAALTAGAALRVQSGTAMELLQTLDARAVFRLVAARIHSVAGGALVAVSEFDPRACTVTVRELQCTAAERRRAIAAMGRDPVGLTLAFPQEVRRRWRVGQLAPVPGGLPELLFHQVPLPVCQRLAGELQLRKLYGMACVHEDDILGTVALATRARRPLRNRKVIEALVTLGALALKRIRAEEALRKRTEELNAARRQDVAEKLRLEALRRALRASERLYHAIGESIDYGVWVCAPDGRNTYASESFLKLVGLTQEQCSDFGWGDTLHPDDAERTLSAWKECVRTQGTWDIEHRFRGVDGRWHPVLARGVAVKDEQGNVLCWAGINLDISRLKEAETALREADARKNEFLAVLSHELRNPLMPIRNGLHLLDRAAPGSDQAVRARAVIGRQIDQLARLVDDLLDVTRISRGKVQVQRAPVELRGLLDRTVDDHRSLFAAAGVALEVGNAGEPLWASADAARIAQAIGNLLHNAVKFTAAGGRVTVSLERDPAGPEAARIRVSDTGIGVEPGALTRLFEPFMQVDSTLGRARGGLGLGLALVKGLIELHGGAVEAHSEGMGKGTEFVVRLPLLGRPAEPPADIAPPSARPASPGGAPAHGRRVLIVDDNADAADSLREVLELAGHAVEVAYSGPDGLDRTRAFRPQIVLCDIGLPGMDGYAVARAIRADAALRSTVLVALTGYALPEDQRRAREMGFDRHLAKPPTLEMLEELLGSLP